MILMPIAASDSAPKSIFDLFKTPVSDVPDIDIDIGIAKELEKLAKSRRFRNIGQQSEQQVAYENSLALLQKIEDWHIKKIREYELGSLYRAMFFLAIEREKRINDIMAGLGKDMARYAKKIREDGRAAEYVAHLVGSGLYEKARDLLDFYNLKTKLKSQLRSQESV